jgi:hypothetical protein
MEKKADETINRSCRKGQGEMCITSGLPFIVLLKKIAANKLLGPKKKRFAAYQAISKPWGFMDQNVDWYESRPGKRSDLPVCVKHCIVTCFPWFGWLLHSAVLQLFLNLK